MASNAVAIGTSGLAFVATLGVMFLYAPPSLNRMGKDGKIHLSVSFTRQFASASNISEFEKMIVLPLCDSCSFKQIDWGSFRAKSIKPGYRNLLLIAPWKKGSQILVSVPPDLLTRVAYLDDFSNPQVSLKSGVPIILDVRAVQTGEINRIAGVVNENQ